MVFVAIGVLEQQNELIIVIYNNQLTIQMNKMVNTTKQIGQHHFYFGFGIYKTKQTIQ